MKNGPIDVVRVIRKGNSVLRYHTRPLGVPETMGHHHANVAMLCWVLCDEFPSSFLMAAALAHDLGEYLTGDVPYPFKKDHPNLKKYLDREEDIYLGRYGLKIEITDEECKILKAADMLDLLYTAKDAVIRGEEEQILTLENGFKALDGVQLPNPAMRIFNTLLKDLKDECERRGLWRDAP